MKKFGTVKRTSSLNTLECLSVLIVSVIEWNFNVNVKLDVLTVPPERLSNVSDKDSKFT